MVNPLQPSGAFYIKTSHLICCPNEMTGFYMKRNTWLKWINKGIKNVITLDRKVRHEILI